MLPLAAAIELIHTYSLIHDDLPAMDDDDLRRGRPTCHVAFGEDVAILAGDGLYAEAFVLLLSRQAASPRGCSRPPRELAARHRRPGMVGGPVHRRRRDRAGGRRRPPPAARAQDRPADRREHRMRAAARRTRRTCDNHSFHGFARELGILFQIVDDILDVTGSDETLGKHQGSDERLGKRTYVTEFGLDGRASSPASPTAARSSGARAGGAGRAPSELEQITDFIATRSY